MAQRVKVETAADLPDFLTEGEDGSLTVALSRGLVLDGAKVMALVLREPNVADQLAAGGGTDAQNEVKLFANLAGLLPADIHALKMRDYARLQAALGFFYN
jgi:hypothetical protein